MEVRFTIKGNEQEIVFSPMKDKYGRMFLCSRVQTGETISIPIISKDESPIFKFKEAADYDRFEESQDIINERLYGVYEEWMETMDNGFDADGEFVTDSSKPGYSPDDIFVENKPFSLKQLIDLIDSGDIDLNPNFQRNFVWDKTRQSRLVESIFLGLPLPSIYLSQYDDGILTIVDGLQRLNTIRRFLKDELRLYNLEYLIDCNGKTFSQLAQVLPPLRLRRFSQTQIMCFVIDYRSPNKLKYDLFRRLNTGGKPLNNQEIRNCLSRLPLQKALKEMVSSDEFKNATDNSIKDTRMDAQEAALRFMYFYDQYKDPNGLDNYSGNMENTLDDYVESINRQKDFQNYISAYSQSMKDAFTLFGRYTFRKVYPNYINLRRNQVNKLLMMVICVLLAKHREQYKNGIKQHKDLTSELATLIDSDTKFFYAITWSTNSKANILYVFKKLKEDIFDKNLINDEQN